MYMNVIVLQIWFKVNTTSDFQNLWIVFFKYEKLYYALGIFLLIDTIISYLYP